MSSDFEHNSEDWDHFQALGCESASSAAELFQSYIKLKKSFEALPKSDLINRGWIQSKDDITSLSGFFRDIHDQANCKLFRKSDPVVNPLISLWLSKVKSEAEMRVLSEPLPSFTGIDKAFMSEIARLSVDVDAIRDLPNVLSRSGIVLVYLRSLSGMKLDGAVFKLSSGHPVVALSFRYPRLDNFWFTLMHELAHVVLHQDILDEPILDDLDIQGDLGDVEVGANRLAKSSFVERYAWRNCEPKYDKSKEAILKFANEQQIHPSIVAGMIRKEEGDYSAYSEIVNSVNPRSLIFDDE
jgi:HTH-type transcriptional regulator/antitoxin HigA